MTGISYFAIAKTYTKSEIEEIAKTYKSSEVFLIRPKYFIQYGKGHFPKYKIYNPSGLQINVYACYESLPTLPVFIKKKSNDILVNQTFENELLKSRNLNSDSINAQSTFTQGKYNMIFYYKNAMDRIQKKQLHNVLIGNLGDFKDSLNVIFINVDRVNF